MYKYELYHHGILGQKHGVRHGPPYPLSRKKSVSIIKRAKKKLDTIAADHRAKKAMKKIAARASVPEKKDARDYTNEELRELNTRMQLEIDFNNRWKQLHPQKVSVGKKFVNHVGKNVLGPALTKVSSKASEYLMGEAANKIIQEWQNDPSIRVFNVEEKKKDKNKGAQTVNNYYYSSPPEE